MKRLAIIKSLLLIAVLSLTPAFASESTDTATQRIQERYQSLERLSAAFVQRTHIQLIDKTVTQQGTIELAKPGQMRIAYTTPNKKDYVGDGKMIWIIDHDHHTIQSYPLTDDTVSREALEFLNGFGKITKRFQISAWQSTSPKKDHTYLTLVPKSKKAPFVALHCEFNKDGVLSHLVIENKSGNQSTYDFTHIQVNPKLPPFFDKNGVPLVSE